MNYTILAIFLTFVTYMTLKIKSVKRIEKNRSDQFWDRERRANETRKQPIDSLPCITIPLEQLPMGPDADETIAACQKRIRALSSKKIINLSGKSNTDIKLEYGAANLNELSACDQNYTDLVRTLYKWGDALFKKGCTEDAITVLEYGVSCKTEVRNHYVLLAQIYKNQQEFYKIEELIHTAGTLDSIRTPSILRSLNELFASCHVREDSL